ncbi:MAG: hypothetical protein PHS99_00805 [Candidatus Marinimicrobia bacterium]|nr:hypothetical protein [Candidatus Neomarinimicrobiota bacterium]
MLRIITLLLLVCTALFGNPPEVLILPKIGAWVTFQEEPYTINERFYLPTYGLNIIPKTVWKSAEPEGILRYMYPNYGAYHLEEGTNIHLLLKESIDIRGKFVKHENNAIYVEGTNQVYIIDPANILYYELAEIPGDKKLEYLPLSFPSKKKNPPVTYGFLTHDFIWSAEYELRWNDKETALFIPWFRVINQGTGTLTSAKVTLLAGDIETQSRNVERAMQAAPKGMGVEMSANAAFAAEAPQSTGDHYIFTLKDYVTFTPKSEFRLPLAAPKEIQPEKKYIVSGNSFSSSGTLPFHADLELTFMIKKDTNDPMVLPEGILRIFNEKGIFGGEVRIPNTPAGEPVIITPGKAFDVVFKRTVLDYKRERETAEGTICYEIRNQSDKSISVIIRDQWYGNWVVKKASHPVEKKSATDLEIPCTIKAGESICVEYMCYVTYR